jgi:hypothetical protein
LILKPDKETRTPYPLNNPLKNRNQWQVHPIPAIVSNPNKKMKNQFAMAKGVDPTTLLTAK